MCGIVGIYSYNQNSDKHYEFIKKSLEDMKNRGPDSSKIWSNNKDYICGFNRLAIRDLTEQANQPMLSICGNYILSFNGEIYNTKYFKDKIKNFGVKFTTNSDTEVLLYGLIHLGFEYVVSNFDGIFAFAFYNKKNKNLILARDRAGVKPLYYGYSKSGLVYSSQYNHVINHQYIKGNSININSVGKYLQFGYMIEGNNGIIDNTSLLEHGHYLLIENNNIKLKSFWNFPFKKNKKTNKSLKSIINESVQNQLVSDVPLGTFLSGGIDSTLITSSAKDYTENLNSYNIGMIDAGIDESKFSNQVASIIQTNHFSKIITEQDMLNLIDSNFNAFSEPFADFSSIPTLFLSEFAKKDVTVCLSGDGGDELFWGYPRNHSINKKIDWIESSKTKRIFRFLYEKSFNKKRIVTRKELVYNNFIEYYYHSLFISGAAYWVPKILNYKMNKVKIKMGNHQNQNLDIMRKLEFDLHLQRILLKVDRASMYHSLEVRVPLLSNNVINKSLEYSFSDCVSDSGKLPLKNILGSKLDKSLINRKKQGFIIPIDNWINTILKDEIKEKLLNMDAGISHLFKRSKINKMLNLHFSNQFHSGWMIWALYSFVVWYNKYAKN